MAEVTGKGQGGRRRRRLRGTQQALHRRKTPVPFHPAEQEGGEPAERGRASWWSPYTLPPDPGPREGGKEWGLGEGVGLGPCLALAPGHLSLCGPHPPLSPRLRVSLWERGARPRVLPRLRDRGELRRTGVRKGRRREGRER